MAVRGGRGGHDAGTARAGVSDRTDVLIVALATTAGWRGAVPALAGAIERAGASVAVAAAAPVREVRTFMATDLVQARAARTAAREGIAAHRPRALIYASATAALLGPRPGAIWFDSPAAQNRPGRHGLWQRPMERRRVAQAPLLLPMSEGGLRALDPRGGRGRVPAVVLPVPVEPSAPTPTPTAERDVAALAYAADAEKKGLARILAAWAQARRPGEMLLVAGQPTGPLGEAPRGPGCSRRTRIAHCCAARASSSPPPATRTTGSHSWRHSPTAADSSPHPRGALTPHSNSQGSSTSTT